MHNNNDYRVIIQRWFGKWLLLCTFNARGVRIWLSSSPRDSNSCRYHISTNFFYWVTIPLECHIAKPSKNNFPEQKKDLTLKGIL